jgi:pyridoxine 5-phosphate synthase
MADLIVNLDSVALLREGCRAFEPDPVQVAALAEAAGAAGISVHLREDRRHVQDRDIRVLKETVKTSLTLAIAPNEPLLLVAEALRPDWVTLVPPGAGMSGAAAGSESESLHDEGLGPAVELLRRAGIRVGLLVQPDLDLVKLAAGIGVQGVSLHAGAYAERFGTAGEEREYESIENAAEYAQKLGLKVRVAEGADFRTGRPLFGIGAVQAFEVGHALAARAMLAGMGEAVRELIGLMRIARPAVSQYRA